MLPNEKYYNHNSFSKTEIISYKGINLNYKIDLNFTDMAYSNFCLSNPFSIITIDLNNISPEISKKISGYEDTFKNEILTFDTKSLTSPFKYLKEYCEYYKNKLNIEKILNMPKIYEEEAEVIELDTKNYFSLFNKDYWLSWQEKYDKQKHFDESQKEMLAKYKEKLSKETNLKEKINYEKQIALLELKIAIQEDIAKKYPYSFKEESIEANAHLNKFKFIGERGFKVNKIEFEKIHTFPKIQLGDNYITPKIITGLILRNKETGFETDIDLRFVNGYVDKENNILFSCVAKKFSDDKLTIIRLKAESEKENIDLKKQKPNDNILEKFKENFSMFSENKLLLNKMYNDYLKEIDKDIKFCDIVFKIYNEKYNEGFENYKDEKYNNFVKNFAIKCANNEIGHPDYNSFERNFKEKFKDDEISYEIIDEKYQFFLNYFSEELEKNDYDTFDDNVEE